MQELSTLLLSIPPHKVTAEKQLDIVHPETNDIHTVSTAEQREWLEWYFKKDDIVEESAEKTAEEDKEQEIICSINQQTTQQTAQQNKEEDNSGEDEEYESPLIPDVQDVDDPEIQEMLKRIEEMGDE
jgi:hypothetical protein